MITQQVNLRQWTNRLSNDFMNKKRRQDNQKLTVTQCADKKRWIGQEHATKSVLGFCVTDHYLRIKTVSFHIKAFTDWRAILWAAWNCGFWNENKFKTYFSDNHLEIELQNTTKRQKSKNKVLHKKSNRHQVILLSWVMLTDNLV